MLLILQELDRILAHLVLGRGESIEGLLVATLLLLDLLDDAGDALESGVVRLKYVLGQCVEQVRVHGALAERGPQLTTRLRVGLEALNCVLSLGGACTTGVRAERARVVRTPRIAE